MSETKGDYSHWESLYRDQPVETMPWFHPGLDPDFEMAISMMDIHTGSVLDLCTGPGTQAVAMAQRGFHVTASDIAHSAVEKACEKARGRGLDITFKQNDILDNRIADHFDYVFDRGCYHVFPERERREYPRAVAGLLNDRGYLFLKCFSHLQEGGQGPYRIHPAEIREFFGPLFEVRSIQDTVFQSAAAFGSRRRRYEPKALFCVLQKR